MRVGLKWVASAPPNSVVTWVDFRFSEDDESVLVFVEVSVKNTTKVFQALKQLA